MSKHLVIFYNKEQDFVTQVADFLAKGLAQGESCVVIATQTHRDAIAAELVARGKDLSADAYLALDAEATLERYMVAGRPNAERFAQTMEPVLERMSQGGRKRLHLFGEMVALEFEAGKTEVAIRIEELWNVLAKGHEFALLCAYPIGQASRMRDYVSLIRACAEHQQAVVPSELWTATHLPAPEVRQA
ncbi:MAG TPA: MEDS domain-containing protein [Gammaproteobacteria bacterium]|nr:MEDS domain-containing protein [Gammaproteobacteria bacterium]